MENVDDDIGGISMWIRAANGDEFFFAHNSVNLITSNGVAVSAGQDIARTGNTGNAATTPPHLHFEIHPGGGPAINPTPSVASWRAATRV